MTSGEINDAGVRQQQDKLFYVSPFIEMAMRYHFRVLPPGERVQLGILTDREGPCSAATFNGSRRGLNTRGCWARSSPSRWSRSRSWRRSTGRRCGSGSRARGWCRGRLPQYRLGDRSGNDSRRCCPPVPRFEARVDRPCEAGNNRRLRWIAHVRVDFGRMETVDATFPDAPPGPAGAGLWFKTDTARSM